MARGWESKSIEDQIAEREAQAEAVKKRRLGPQEQAVRAQRDGLLLVRVRTLKSLESTRDPRYIELLQRTLKHLDAQLADLEPPA